MSRSDSERLRDAQFHLEILDSHMQKAGLDDQTVADGPREPVDDFNV